MRLLKIDSVMYFVQNLKASADFYEQALGLKKAWSDKENGQVGFVFPDSDSEVVLHSDPSLPSPDFSFLVENVEACVREFRERGRGILSEPIEVRCGKFAIVADPDGNKVPIIDLTKFGGIPKHEVPPGRE